MSPLFRRRLSRAVLGGFLIGSSLIGFAQDDSTPGIVRISDARPRNVPAQTVGLSSHHYQGEYVDFGGACPGDCPNGYGCPYGKHCHLGKFFHEHYCSHSADHGFSIPGKYPIYRRGVQYNAYFPAKWYGTSGDTFAQAPIYPTVYQPTDTTQLGYYYQHVPFWMPNPNALPPRPIPAQWHNLVPVAHLPWDHAHGGYGGLWHGKHGRWGRGGYCPPGDGWVEGTTVAPSMTPTPNNQQSIEQVPPATEPAPSPTPDAPKNDSAQNLHIRRAALAE